MIRFAPGSSPSTPLQGLAIVENPHVLGGLQPGEFVVVRGNWLHQAEYGGSAPPAYRVSVVQRQQL